MQDLSRYKKKESIEIDTRYVSLLLAGSVALVGLVFALGVIVGSRGSPEPRGEPPDPLAALDAQSREPAPPPVSSLRLRTFHDTLRVPEEAAPNPASLPIAPSDEAQEEGEETALAAPPPPLERPKAEEEPMPERVPEDEPGVYSLQVASFQDQAEATDLVRKLRRAGHRSFLVGVDMPERGGQWFRVRVGPFQSKRAAWSYKESFEERERLPTFVVKRGIKG